MKPCAGIGTQKSLGFDKSGLHHKPQDVQRDYENMGETRGELDFDIDGAVVKLTRNRSLDREVLSGRRRLKYTTSQADHCSRISSVEAHCGAESPMLEPVELTSTAVFAQRFLTAILSVGGRPRGVFPSAGEIIRRSSKIERWRPLDSVRMSSRVPVLCGAPMTGTAVR